MVVVPSVTPVTSPDELIVAFAGVEEVHTPPLTVLVSNVVVAGHNVVVPLMIPALGNGLTVTTFVAATVPQLLVTV
jgi:hypothetical protein